MTLFIDVTKHDVEMSNYIWRAKSLVYIQNPYCVAESGKPMHVDLWVQLRKFKPPVSAEEKERKAEAAKEKKKKKEEKKDERKDEVKNESGSEDTKQKKPSPELIA